VEDPADRLPLDADDNRLLAAATGGNLTAARAYLLQQLSDRPYDDRKSTYAILAAVVAQDPGWLEGYLDRFLASLPGDVAADQREGHLRSVLDGVLENLWNSEPESLWRAVGISPRLRVQLSDFSQFVSTALNHENAMRVLDPVFDFDDLSVRALCASLPDAEVQGHILEMVKQGRFDGTLPPESITALLKMQTEQPEAFRSLEERMTPEMQTALADAWNPAEPAASAASPGREGVPDTSEDYINGIVKKTGLATPIAAVVELYPNSGAAAYMSSSDYFLRHLSQIDNEMRQLIAKPGDRERLEQFADDFFADCESQHRDPVQLMDWREALNEDNREGLFAYFAERDAAGALKYAQEKMAPGPDRDALVKAAMEQLP